MQNGNEKQQKTKSIHSVRQKGKKAYEQILIYVGIFKAQTLMR